MTEGTMENHESEITDYGDAQVVITIARWRSYDKEQELRIQRAAEWVERKVRTLISGVSSTEFGTFGFRSPEEYCEYLENIILTLAPEPLRQKFRSHTIDTLLHQHNSLGLPSPSKNQE